MIYDLHFGLQLHMCVTSDQVEVEKFVGPLGFCCKEILLYLAQVTKLNPSSGWSPLITDIRPASVTGIAFFLAIVTTCVA